MAFLIFIIFFRSEREGFGHYLNEARSVGALILTTDHAPMSKLIDGTNGILVRPEERCSYYDWQALSQYGELNARVSPA